MNDQDMPPVDDPHRLRPLEKILRGLPFEASHAQLHFENYEAEAGALCAVALAIRRGGGDPLVWTAKDVQLKNQIKQLLIQAEERS
jgi:hypothetical protein